MSADHCAFCDSYPFYAGVTFTIEHFFPKEHYKRIAYFWHNLFPCCGVCQEESQRGWRELKRLARPPRLLLKPDRGAYHFSRYFIVELTTGGIEPNPRASRAEQDCAQMTLDVYGLNLSALRLQRKKHLEYFRLKRDAGEQPCVDDFNYRDFIEAGL